MAINQLILDNVQRGAAQAGEMRANVGNPNQRLVWRGGKWEDAGQQPLTPQATGAMSSPAVTYSNPKTAGYKLQVLGNQSAGSNDPMNALAASMSDDGAVFGSPQASVYDTVRRTGNVPGNDPRVVGTVLTPGAVRPGLDAGGRVIDERGGMGSPSAIAPTLGVNAGGQAAVASSAPMASKPARPTGNLPAAIQAARDYTPGAMEKAPRFKNYYSEETQPFDAAYEAALRNNVINTAEQQYRQGGDRVRSLLASRGLMSGGGTGLEAAMMGQLAMEAAGARERGMNQATMDTAQKRADFNMRRAEGLMSAQRDEFGRYIDQQKLPLLLDEQKARVKSMLLQNGVDQYAAERLMEMDANEWPDLLKNILKGGMIAGGIYTANPALVAAGASYR